MRRLLGLLACAGLLLAGTCADDDSGSGSGSGGESGEATLSGLPTVVVSALPPEARDTLALIAAGGPYPYDRDGAVFENRERLLPPQDRGYYREYTVPTPGSDDRGARRIVTGEDGERFYTDDHYESFKEVVE